MLKWLGKGSLYGIPARDLREDEVEKYGGEKVLLKTGLYAKLKAKDEVKENVNQSVSKNTTWN